MAAPTYTTATLEDDGVDKEWDGEDWKFYVKHSDGLIMCVCDELQTAHDIAKLLSERAEKDKA